MSVEDSKSLKLNMMLNAIKSLMSILFPLISFPYVSRVLGVDNLGQYNFANSIISYFILLAGLGISTYAVREGAKVRDDSKAFENFANQMFSINVISTVFSYVLLAILVITVDKFQNYKTLLLILALQIGFTTIGVEWIYSVYEDYLFITIRSIAIQLVSLFLLFTFVKDANDLIVYSLVSVFANAGACVLNFFWAKRYCHVKFVHSIKWKKHLKPILMLFAMSVTVTLYVSSDITILGFMCSDYAVGIYAVSSKIYTIIKTLISSVLVVSIPRLSALIGRNSKEEFNIVASDIYGTLITVLIPAIVGIIILRDQIILIISGEEFITATYSLAILSIALFFCLGAWFWGQCVLVPMCKENIVFKITLASAFVNIILNFILIPIWEQNATALTTLIAEAISFLWCGFYGRKYVKLMGIKTIFIKVLVGCGGIVLTADIVFNIIDNIYICTITTILCSIIVYLVVEIIIKNEILLKNINVLLRHM